MYEIKNYLYEQDISLFDTRVLDLLTSKDDKETTDEAEMLFTVADYLFGKNFLLDDPITDVAMDISDLLDRKFTLEEVKKFFDDCKE